MFLKSNKELIPSQQWCRQCFWSCTDSVMPSLTFSVLLCLVPLLVTSWLQDGCCSSKQHTQEGHSLQCGGFKRALSGKNTHRSAQDCVSLANISIPAGQVEKTSIWQWHRDNRAQLRPVIIYQLWGTGCAAPLPFFSQTEFL